MNGPKAIRDELRETIREHKAELSSLLRAGRVAEVHALFAQAFARLGAMYTGSLIGNLWPAIVRNYPALATSIDSAEQGADAAGLAYQSGDAPDAGPFLAALATWESRWADAIGAVTDTSRACDDCGRRDATILVTTATGKFCRRCLWPAPLASPPKGRAHA